MSVKSIVKEKEEVPTKGISLPTKKGEILKDVPSSMIIFGLPKSGKTTILAELPNCLDIDVERGSDFVEIIRLQPPKDIKPVALVNWLKEVVQAIKDEGRPYDFVAIETVSYLDEIAEWVGTYRYMNTTQGKRFNRDSDGNMLKSTDPGYESVHTLPDGNGYRYSRAVMTEIFDMCKDLGKICTIFVCHVTDKYIISKQTNTEVRAMDLSLTGKVKHIYSRDVDAIGYVWNKGGEMNISFEGSEEKLGGMRGIKGLQGYKGPLDWKKIFKL